MAYPASVKPAKSESKSPSSSANKRPGGEGSWLKGLITLVVVLVIIGGGIYLVASYTGIDTALPAVGTKSASFKSDWQAVFLSNGQVYFGQIDKISSDFVTLSNIYYLQVMTLQNTIGQPPDVQTQPEQRLTLIKLGNEIHGPEDEMQINRDHIIIIEDLKSDSRVIQAVNDYLANQGQ